MESLHPAHLSVAGTPFELETYRHYARMCRIYSCTRIEGGNVPQRGPVAKRQATRITDCMDCWKRGWCFLFFEQWPDETSRGIWLCCDCIDKRPVPVKLGNVCDEHELQLASAPNVVSLTKAASLAAGDRLGEVQGPMERNTNESQRCICKERGVARALGPHDPRCSMHDTEKRQ